MHLHRFVIGIQFNEKMFRLPSLGGIVIDDILNLRNNDKRLGSSYFSYVSTPINSINAINDYSISLVDEKKVNELTILQDQFVFKKTSSNTTSSLNIDKTIEEFTILWKTANKSISFGDIRRIGFVGEYLIDKKTAAVGPLLVDCLTKFNKPESCSTFRLTFEDRKLNKSGDIPNAETADFWNTIFTFYNSEADETPEKGKIYANIDLQKYYNPTKTDPIKELTIIKNTFNNDIRKFKETVKEMGLCD